MESVYKMMLCESALHLGAAARDRRAKEVRELVRRASEAELPPPGDLDRDPARPRGPAPAMTPTVRIALLIGPSMAIVLALASFELAAHRRSRSPRGRRRK
jgi:hypothetical protein